MKTKNPRMRNMKKAAAIIGTAIIGTLAALLPSKARAEDDTIKKFMIETTYTVGKNVLKVRPFDHTLPSKTQQADILFGRKFGSFIAYSYLKFDDEDRSWVGTRFDYMIKGLEGKLSTNLQFRFFKGLNEKSRDHLYFIPSTSYRVGRFKVGVLAYGKKSEGQKPFFYIGPSVGVDLTKNVSAMVTYDKDVLSNNKLLFCSLSFKF